MKRCLFGGELPEDHQKLNNELAAMAANNRADVNMSAKSVDKSTFNEEEILNRKVEQWIWAKYPRYMSANEIFDVKDVGLQYRFTASVIEYAKDPEYTIVVAEKYIEKLDAYLEKLVNGEKFETTTTITEKGALLKKCQMLSKIGKAYLELGDREKAKEYFKIVQGFYPKDRIAADGMAILEGEPSP